MFCLHFYVRCSLVENERHISYFVLHSERREAFVLTINNKFIVLFFPLLSQIEKHTSVNKSNQRTYTLQRKSLKLKDEYPKKFRSLNIWINYLLHLRVNSYSFGIFCRKLFKVLKEKLKRKFSIEVTRKNLETYPW